MIATEAAYRHGEIWLEGLLNHLRANHQYFAEGVSDLNGGLQVLPANSLYLAWMDCRSLELNADELHHFMLTKARLWLDSGKKFGAEGHGYMRVNLGCSRSTVNIALERLRNSMANR